MRGQLPFFCVFPVKFLRLSSDASHVRRDGGALGDRALPFPAREICFAAAIRIAPSRLGIIIIPKIRPADGNFAARFLRRRPIRALSAGRSL